MPIYEYLCESCGKQFDFLARRISQQPDACPECGATTLKKRLSVFNAKVASGAGPTTSSCPTGTCCPTGRCSLE